MKAFIREHLRLAPLPAVPEIALYTAHPGSGLARRAGDAPYWAYAWGGGLALARHILDRPEIVAGRRVIDLGSGSGLVAIAAAKAGASDVTAVDVDPLAIAATEVNAEANSVRVRTLLADLLDGPAPDADLILVGDLFYAPKLAKRVLPFLERCRAAGGAVLVGDPGRRDLPLKRLALLAEYRVPDFGDGAAVRACGVYALA